MKEGRTVITNVKLLIYIGLFQSMKLMEVYLYHITLREVSFEPKNSQAKWQWDVLGEKGCTSFCTVLSATGDDHPAVMGDVFAAVREGQLLSSFWHIS